MNAHKIGTVRKIEARLRAYDAAIKTGATKEEAMKPMKDAWVWHFHKDHWEFHGPDGFYWHGSADNAYEARAKGWSAWLRKQGADGYALNVNE